jgi:hypothetical protein
VWRLGAPNDNDGGTVKSLAGKQVADWEHGGAHLPQALNEAGADGWELVGIHYFESSLRDPVFIFKRPRTASDRALK